MRETFEVTTQNYDKDRRLIENIIAEVEWGIHGRSDLEVGEPSKLFGWTFFTVSLDVEFLVKMVDLYESFRNAKGWTHYEKFENWLNERLKKAGSKASVKATAPQGYSGLF